MENVKKTVKKWINRLLYGDVADESQIGQVFIANQQIDTLICLNNYHSFLLPEQSLELPVRICLRDRNGKIMLRRSYKLACNGSISISVKELLGNLGLKSEAEIGLVTCSSGYGKTQFFTHYYDSTNRSMATVHPQSNIGRFDRGATWRSNQSIMTKNLASITLYQANHSINQTKVNYSVCDFYSHVVIATKSIWINPLSAGSISFDLEEIGTQSNLVYIQTDALPTPNGKCLIMREFSNGHYSMSHG